MAKNRREFMDLLGRATLNGAGYTPEQAARIVSARALLTDLPEDESEPVIDACVELSNNLRGRGIGAVTIFEIVTALGQKLAKESRR